MRVIAGNFKGRKLKSLAGMDTRPTTDKVKESLFNRIGPYFDGEVVLDLYAGSGALAIEAMSRGCARAYLVEKNFKAFQIIRENVAMTHVADKFVLLKKEANKALHDFAEANQQFDLVFLDPPYKYQEIEKQVLLMQEKKLLANGAKIICETDKSVQLPEKMGVFTLTRRAVYGICALSIYENEGDL